MPVLLSRVKQTKKAVIVLLVGLLALTLSGCDNTDYKTRIQKENDHKNPNGNQSACLMVGDIYPSMYPYTIHYIKGEIDPTNPRDEIRRNNRVNLKLSLFAKEGLLIEEQVGIDGDKPLYRYALTDEGRKYVKFWNGTNFCFGRIVVDSIYNVSDGQNGVGGGKIRNVTFFYHLENIPKWAQNKAIYSLYPGYGGIEDAVLGKKSSGTHTYSVKSNGDLRLFYPMSGAYYP